MNFSTSALYVEESRSEIMPRLGFEASANTAQSAMRVVEIFIVILYKSYCRQADTLKFLEG